MSNRALDGWEVIARADELVRGGEEFALATVVWRQGPSSGQQGSRAIVNATGEIQGWIGGACAEPVVIREAQRVIRDREPKLLLLGNPGQFGGAVPDGITVIPIACQSEGALEVYLEPVVPTTHLVVVGRSPMAHTLADFARGLGWRCDLREVADFSAADVGATSVVVIATQGHGDEEALEEAVSASPAFVGLVASRRRGETVLGYLADKGLAREQLDRVKVPVGLDLGRTSHREIAVSILAELVQLRASGALREDGAEDQHGVRQESASTALAVDPVCGMTVAADPSSRPVEHAGTTYYFCSAGCRAAFEKDPQTYITGVSAG
ncbi:MAG TPA: XdhC family protein [Nocardioidaceae bacterium]|jgi:xanthine dehydrogenase accessory factor